MKQMIKLALTLAVYSVIACLALAAVNMQTSPRIEAAKKGKIGEALKVIFPDADNFKEVTAELPRQIEASTVGDAYIAEQGEKAIGMTITFSGHTFGDATILVGVDTNRNLKMIKFLELTDSPGLGSLAAEPPFITQFDNKLVDDPFKLGEDIAVISGATITSKAVADMVKAASLFAGNFLAENYGCPKAGEVTPAEKPAEKPVKNTLMPPDRALATIFPNGVFEDISSQFQIESEYGPISSMGAWIVKSWGKVRGIAIQMDDITYTHSTVVVGIDMNGRVLKVCINETKDTNIFAARKLDESLCSPFTGMQVNELFDEGLSQKLTIDAISAATIPVQGLANIVRLAADYGAGYLAENYGGKAPDPVSAEKLHTLFMNRQ
ncbi:electron transport complex, RnfABCDGE type, G subunit [Treponema phagedenis F0421]|uniref:FMN-binding protein n=1 Tax=Treponema phagedenis TaxID=162 RepID=UPI0001F63F4C|nr:FMN-binding protein [Treponema phagedenis]EFW37501.1 electron transport complex, RnfABCDGE type, G subunit [Treponema phagedenis F0421]